MNGLDAAQLALLGDLLERRRANLAGHHGLTVTDNSRDLAVQEVETSPADKATVRMIKHALAKFDDGSYGECEECGNPIGFSRLQARPEARLCIKCQTRAEKR